MADLLNEENTTILVIKEIFETALFQTTTGNSGELIIKDGYNYFVDIEKGLVKFSLFLKSSDLITHQRKLSHANFLMNGYLAVRVTVAENGTFIFEHAIFLAGGITRLTVASAFRRFVSIIQVMIEDDPDKVLG